MHQDLKHLDGFEISFHEKSKRIINIKIEDQVIERVIFPFKKFDITALEYKPFTRFTIAKSLDETTSHELGKLLNHILKNRNTGCFIIGPKIISKPSNRNESFKILQKLNVKQHYLISSVCISRNGSMIWNYTDKATLTMKNMSNKELEHYLSKITDEALYAYNVYQVEGEGKSLFSRIDGDENTIMGLPINKIKDYLRNYE